ncbi:Short-chain dehydrogenase [Nakamurella panacisegetis]|uniref:Short-chain dehydrogenase n=1 Tax=Nakamurella panacisegetis TaxID=1090615 RepID=A0A1H0HSN3_9ACTN|nr:oxidoreductase [Nakamurella panacisegetis]SDO22157.1 Short-chain dehydrogenase [Nakamurella panacisegetis]
MDTGLRGRRAVVTGASKGIGLAIVESLAAEGAHVIAGARHSSPRLDALVAAGSVTAARVDLATPDGPQHLIDQALAGGGVDILVNNVGAVTPRVDGFLAVTDEQWMDSMNLTFMAAVRSVRAVLPGMLAAGSGTIVTVASVNSFLPDPGVIDYCAAKAALANFSKALSKEVGPLGIRVNTVSPGPVETDLWLAEGGVADAISGASGQDPATIVAAATAGTATGRFTQPQEVADLVVLLAGTRAANVTGADFVIDGGLTSTL